ncbi:Ig-like domain-containing protein [Flavobacterium undicola]|uniref:Ig-like domain-containing protein n=1 Tax=Flavobacterium undicola TaxID=1932779 RepID=UPI0015E1CFB4|nr:T9SS type A sorting domain-containing protein [Flavobacterium undicola]MBA0882333.1 T9SS type A sorting domain-containing protein [Flavobacterium undicola]
MKNRIILFALLAIVSNANAQSISRKLVSNAGGTLTGGNSQITFSIGETIIPSLNTASAMITQGFQQPGEQIKTGSVSTVVCAGSSFNLPYTATDIGGGNTFTAQLSNALGSFASPVNIGTLSGNASVGVINVTIPSNTVAGSGYKIRITSSSPAFVGTDNGADVAINAGPIVNISYSGSPYCSTGTAFVTRTGPAGGVYSSSAGLSINSSTGSIDLGASLAGTYSVTYNFSSGGCSGTATTNVVILVPTVAVVATQNFCNSATVASLPNGGGAYKWYAKANNGTELSSSTILSTGTYYVSNTSGGCESARTAVNVTITTVTAPSVAAQNFCSSATVASLPNGSGIYKWYDTVSGGAALTSSTVLSSKTYYVSTTSGACESARTAVSVTVSPNVTAGTVSGTTSLCKGVTATYTSSGTTGGSWSSTNTAVATVNASTGVVTAVNAGTTFIRYTVTTGCGSPVMSSSGTLTVSVLPTTSISYSGSPFCKSGSVNVTRTGQESGTYTSSPSGLSINPSTGSINLETSSTGTYTVTYSFSNGTCSGIATTTLKIKNCNNRIDDVSTIAQKSSLEVTVDKFDVIAYPNPSNYQFTLSVDSDSNEKIDVVIYDISGKMLRHIQKNKEESIIFGKEFPTGVYVVVINQGINKKTIKLIKE